MARSSGFHPGKRGSIPLRATELELVNGPVRLSVRTPGFHPGKRGSIPLRATELVVNKFYKIVIGVSVIILLVKTKVTVY
jgi:hypothetical protein